MREERVVSLTQPCCKSQNMTMRCALGLGLNPKAHQLLSAATHHICFCKKGLQALLSNRLHHTCAKYKSTTSSLSTRSTNLDVVVDDRNQSRRGGEGDKGGDVHPSDGCASTNEVTRGVNSAPLVQWGGAAAAHLAEAGRRDDQVQDWIIHSDCQVGWEPYQHVDLHNAHDNGSKIQD